MTTTDNNEVPLAFEELFFSRTDTRGIIRAGNSVFQRISLYDWHELLERPHNLIRHADMPKGVFWVLWDFLKRGKPIGAYVKNRAKDGRHYWVFAIVTPIEDGYLSVRLKPGSDIFPVVQSLYADLLQAERTRKLSAQDSASLLMETLQQHSFSSYEHFMSIAACQEMMHRDQMTASATNRNLGYFTDIIKATDAMTRSVRLIYYSYEKNRYVPVNLKVQAALLGEEGKTIGVVSGNYSIVSEEIRQELNLFSQSAEEVCRKVYEGQFLLCTSCIQREVIEYFRNEPEIAEVDSAVEMAHLDQQQSSYHRTAHESMQKILRQFASFKEDSQRMKMLAASLEVIRVMGKVDAARLSQTQSGLSELMNDLRDFQSSIAQNLSDIDRNHFNMNHNLKSIIRNMEAPV